jgi:hypothetical protein
MNENTNFSQIPANACIVAVGEFQLGDNGPNAKTAPVRLVARSGKPIEHWFWGRVVHDMAGMHLHKSRLPIDYVHDSKEVIGFLNHFETESGDLVTSGALVPYGSNDRASEIIHKMREGVPYEASINFGGDGIKVQELAAGEMAEVNGAMFDGPGVIVREWPLRGVAVCPYGADANTESKAFGNNNSKTFSASVIKTEQPEPTKEATAMSEAVENVASEPVPEVVVELDESKPVEVVSEEAAPVEAPKKPQAKRGRPKAEPKPKPAPKAKPPAAPTARREPPICSGTAPRITTGEVGVIPRMVCHRPGADAHLSVPSRQGDAFVPHRAPVAMCSSPK